LIALENYTRTWGAGVEALAASKAAEVVTKEVDAQE